ncbi:MAG TPA: GspB domain-containing protein [Deltaproteobacteria bacterium]|nr:GspB domain-containing protein [Deltaproteobacteria bacterium]
MSIILDALKRSDRERRLQKPPDLSQIYQENHPPKRRTMVWVLLIVVVLIAGVSGAYFLFQKDPGVENTKRLETTVADAGKKKNPREKQKSLRKFSAKPAKAQTVQEQESSESVSEENVVQGPASRRRAKAREDDQIEDKEPAEDLSTEAGKANFFDALLAKGIRTREKMAESIEGGAHPLASLFSGINKSRDQTAGTETAAPSPAKLEPPAPNAEVNTPAPARDQTAILSTPRGISIVEPEAAQVEKSEPVSESKAQEEAAEEDSVPVASEPEKKNAVVASGAEKITLMENLPYEPRQKYEDLQINVHIYDEKMEERRVFINMHSYKEGEKIEESGPLLVAIIPEGIIVDYGEGKVQMNVKK